MPKLLENYQALINSKKLQPDPAQLEFVTKLDQHAQQIVGYFKQRTKPLSKLWQRSTAEVPRGLYIHGEVGQGKSLLMQLFYDSLPLARKQYIHFHHLMEEVHLGMHRWHRKQQYAKRGEQDGLQFVAAAIAKRLDVLCVDELQVTEIGEAMIVSRLFGLLIESGVVLNISSNRMPAQLYKDGVDKQYFTEFLSLLEAHMQVMSLAAKHDYRRHMQQSADQVYFTPLNKTSTAAIAKWSNRLGLLKPQGRSLAVHERLLFFPLANLDVLLVDFADLCGTPLGPADYQLLADSFKAIILINIPELKQEDRNEAKRLVTLIDQLYQKKVLLICSAAIDPGQLYLAGDGSFEFARTTSRLLEMQSADYIAAAEDKLTSATKH